MYELCHVCKYFCLEEMCVIYISVVKVRLSRNECHESTITYECNTMIMYECHMNTVVVRVTCKQKVRWFLYFLFGRFFFVYTFFVTYNSNSICFVYFFFCSKIPFVSLFEENFCWHNLLWVVCKHILFLSWYITLFRH